MKYKYSYFQKLYDTNYQNVTWDGASKQRNDRFFRIVKYIKAGNSVLDFAGGNGDLHKFLPKVSYKILDLSNEHKISKFRRVLLKNGLYIDEKNKKYDVVVMSEILEHIPNCYETLNEVKRVLKDNGTLIITVPNPFSFPFILKSFFGLHQDTSKEHLYWFDWSYLSNILLAAGFSLVEKQTFCVFPSKIYDKIYYLDAIFSKIFPHNGAQLLCVFRKHTK